VLPAPAPCLLPLESKSGDFAEWHPLADQSSEADTLDAGDVVGFYEVSYSCCDFCCGS